VCHAISYTSDEVSSRTCVFMCVRVRVRVCACAYVCVCVCVCVWLCALVAPERRQASQRLSSSLLCVQVCMYVCVSERTKKRERLCVCSCVRVYEKESALV